MKEEAILKINKVGKVSAVFALICKIVVGMGIALLLFGAAILYMIPKEGISFATEEHTTVEVDAEKLGETFTDEDFEEFKKEMEKETGAKLSLGGEDIDIVAVERAGNGFRLIGEQKNFELDMHQMAGAFLILAVLMGVTQVTIYFISGLCKAFRDCKSPFEENVIKKMRNLAFALIPWTVSSSLTNVVANTMIRKNNEITLSVDLGMVLVVLVVFLLTYIFKYGAVLQQESDETL